MVVHDDRLGGRDPQKRRQGDECRGHARELAPALRPQGEEAADAFHPSVGEPQGRERDRRRKHEQRVERREEREADQNPPPTTPTPFAPPKPKPPWAS